MEEVLSVEWELRQSNTCWGRARERSSPRRDCDWGMFAGGGWGGEGSWQVPPEGRHDHRNQQGCWWHRRKGKHRIALSRGGGGGLPGIPEGLGAGGVSIAACSTGDLPEA